MQASASTAANSATSVIIVEVIGYDGGDGNEPPAPQDDQRRKPPGEQCVGGRLAERGQLVAGQPAVGERALVSPPRNTKQPRVGTGQAMSRLSQGDGAGPVEPLRVVDDQQRGLAA